MAEKTVLETVKLRVRLPPFPPKKYGSSSDWLECLSWEQEVAGSSPVSRTKN